MTPPNPRRSIEDLIESAKDCEEDAEHYYDDTYAGKLIWKQYKPMADFKAGHRAAFDKLAPALTLAVEWLEYYVHDVLKTDDRIAQIKIRALLGGGEEEDK